MNNNVGLAVRNSAPMVNVPTIKNGEIDVFKLGEVFARSGYFTDAKDASQAIVKIIAGSEIGIGAMASMTGFHIVNGKPVLAANLIASLIKNKKSGYNYRVLEMDDTVCEIEFFENGEPIGKSKFSMDDARTAGITGKDVWKKFPKNMLFARAISNGAKWFCPDVFNGSMVYTPEELGVEVDGDGEILQMPQSLPQQPEPLKQIASSLTETEEKILAEMKVLLEAAGESEKIIADSEEWFRKTTPEIRPNGLRKARRAVIKFALSNQDFDEEAITTYLDGFGITEGIDNAGDDQLAKCVSDMFVMKMI